MGLTQNELAGILNTSPTTIRKWEADDNRNTSRKPNPVAAQVLRWMLAGFRPPEWPVSDADKGAGE